MRDAPLATRAPGGAAITWLLTADEVAGLLDMPEAIAATEAAYAEQAEGLVVLHGPYALGMMPDRPDETSGSLMTQRLRIVSGGLLGTGKVGLRTGPRVPATDSGGTGTVLLLYDVSGALLSIMGYPFSTMRTGASIGVAVKYLSREDAHRVALLGTGANALSLLRAVACVRSVTDVRVYSRNEQHRREFAQASSADLGLPVEPAAEPQEAVAGAQIVLLSTNAREPVFSADWLEEGMHVSSMGLITELDPEAMVKADLFAVGSRAQELQHHYDPRPPFPIEELVEAGRLTWDRVVELGDIVAGKRQGRPGPGDITVFHESEGGYGDVALAAVAFDEARRRGLGQWVPL